MDRISVSPVPWAPSYAEFLEEASTVSDGAICLFLIANDIPAHARSGYGTLVIAYTRQAEPVTVFEDGSSVLLIKEGGVEAAEIASRRILAQMAKLRLEKTLRVVVAPFSKNPAAAIESARNHGQSTNPGEVSVCK